MIKIRFIDWFCLSSLILWIENTVWLATTNRIMLVSITEVGRHSPYVRIVWPPCQHTVASFIIMLRADYDTEKLPYLPWDTNISIPNISMEITLYIMSYESRSTVKLLILLKLNLQSCSSTCCVHLDCYHTESVDLVAILAKEIAWTNITFCSKFYKLSVLKSAKLANALVNRFRQTVVLNCNCVNELIVFHPTSRQTTS